MTDTDRVPAPASRRRLVWAAAAAVPAGALLVGLLATSGNGAVALTSGGPTLREVLVPQADTAALPDEAVSAVARNPFKALYTAPAGSGDGTTTDTGPTTTGPTTSTPTTGTAGPTYAPVPDPDPVPLPGPSTPVPPPTTPPPTTPPPSTQPPTSPPTSPPAAVPYALTLDAVSPPKGEHPRALTWTVDGKKETVVRGERFGLHGELVVLSVRATAKGDVVVLQVGTAEPIVVPVGQTITVP